MSENLLNIEVSSPIVFISYSWDSEEHKQWVLQLADKLLFDGIDVKLDRYELRLGKHLTSFIENSIKNSQRIIIIFTPNYKLKADNRNGGVGYEYSIINTEIYNNIIQHKKLIPILRSGKKNDSIPDFIQQFIYLDWSDDGAFEKNYQELLRELYNEPEYKKPDIGKKPEFKSKISRFQKIEKETERVAKSGNDAMTPIANSTTHETHKVTDASVALVNGLNAPGKKKGKYKTSIILIIAIFIIVSIGYLIAHNKAKTAKTHSPNTSIGAENTDSYEANTNSDTTSFNKIEPAMVPVPGGTFQMGTNKTYPDEEPLHTIQISNFKMGKYEITVGEFRKFINDQGYVTDAEKEGYSYVYDGSTYKKKNGVNWQSDIAGNKRSVDEEYYPVIHVSWNDANAYCRWLSKYTHKRYRLPTEAEWEYAAKGGPNRENYAYSGGNSIVNVAWYDANSGNIDHIVGQKRPNSLGIYDMSGNVWEWCEDWYGEKYYNESPQSNPKGPLSGEVHVLRGGSWYCNPTYCRSTCRGFNIPTYRNYDYGFRIVASDQ